MKKSEKIMALTYTSLVASSCLPIVLVQPLWASVALSATLSVVVGLVGGFSASGAKAAERYAARVVRKAGDA